MPRLPLPHALHTVARVVVATLTAAATMLVIGCGRGGESDTSTWRGAVPPGAWLRVSNVNGAVRVARSAGPEVVVTGRRSYRGRRAEPVHLLSERSGNDVRICAVWGAHATSCRDRGNRGLSILARLFRGYSTVRMDVVVAVPAGVHVQATTVNGSVTVADATGEVDARSTNGDVTIAASGGPVRGRSVNGSVLASVAALDSGAPVALRSTNGSVTAMLPATLAASLDLATTNGRVSSDFPLAPSTPRAKRLHGVIGGGGRTVELTTVNGNVRLEQAH